MKLIVTIDVEEDAGPDWVSPPTSTFRGVAEGIGSILQPMFKALGVKSTLMISPIVMQDRRSVDILGTLASTELASHLHWEQLAPSIERSTHGGHQLLRHMQRDFPHDMELRKLEVLTELFRQQFGFRPTAFRAGRYGASHVTGALLKSLGYEVDSSATPHRAWPTPGGALCDYTSVPEQPYYIGAGGDLYRQGDFDLLEVPITIMPQERFPSSCQPPWLRPTFASVDVMRDMIRIVRKRNQTGVAQPLVFMFHNVEVIPGASPYTKTKSDVASYLRDLRSVLEYALKLGFKPVTLTEYARTYKQNLQKKNLVRQEYQHDLMTCSKAANGIGIPYAAVRSVVDRYGVPPWHLYIYKDRLSRWDVTAPCAWAVENLPPTASVLSAGCGMAFNLMWLAYRGFADLTGFDIDPAAIAAAAELADKYRLPLRLSVADVGGPVVDPGRSYDYIEALNCLMYAESDYIRFLKSYGEVLNSEGFLALDVIDASYDRMPNNQYLTSDWSKPEAERAPSEYKLRWSEKDICYLAAQHGLSLVHKITASQAVPRVCYIFQKFLGSKTCKSDLPAINERQSCAAGQTRRPRVLFCVDLIGWAHDFKTTNLIKYLSYRFDCRKVFQDGLSQTDFEWADVVIVYYWGQFHHMLNFIDILGRRIVLTGISDHTDLEGGQRDLGMSILRGFNGVWVHNQLLYDEYKGQFSNPFYLNQNGVDTSFYCPLPESRSNEQGNLVVGWAGSLSNHGTKRGYYDIIVPAIEKTPGVILKTAAREEKWRGPDEMREFYRTLDLYIVASRVEGTPNPGLEAAACGVPIVSTRVGNMVELINHGVNGMLYERSPEALSEVLSRLRDDRSLIHKMSNEIRRSIVNWDWSIMSKKYEKMISESIGRYGIRS